MLSLSDKIALISLAVAMLSLLGQVVVGVYALGVFRGEFMQLKEDVKLIMAGLIRNGWIPPRTPPAKGENGYESWSSARERS